MLKSQIFCIAGNLSTIINSYNLGEILHTLTFILHIFLWLDVASRVKPVETMNVAMVLPLSIWVESNRLVSAGLNSGRFQNYNRKWKSFQRRQMQNTFSIWKKSFDDVKTTTFCWKIPKIQILPNSMESFDYLNNIPFEPAESVKNWTVNRCRSFTPSFIHWNKIKKSKLGSCITNNVRLGVTRRK